MRGPSPLCDTPGDSLSEHEPESPDSEVACSYWQWHHDCHGDKNRRKDPNKYHPSVKFAAVSSDIRSSAPGLASMPLLSDKSNEADHELNRGWHTRAALVCAKLLEYQYI